SGGPPEPLFQKVVGEVLQARLRPPIIFTHNEHKSVCRANFSGKIFHRRRSGGYSLYIRSRIGSPISRASISSGKAPRARSSLTTKLAMRIPTRVVR